MINKIIREIKNYFSQQPVKKVWIFGSLARGEIRSDSDIDIIVEFEQDNNIGLFEHVQMSMDLENKLNRKVDLITEGTFYPWIQANVDKDKILIYER